MGIWQSCMCIHEVFKDLCIDCIFCNNEVRDMRDISNKEMKLKSRKKNKSTQTEITNLIDNIKEPGSI